MGRLFSFEAILYSHEMVVRTLAKKLYVIFTQM